MLRLLYRYFLTILRSNMARYRRYLSESEQKRILNKYKNHRDAEGGIFGSDIRRRLMGVKDRKRVLYKHDTTDFWHDVRTYVKNALTDLQLVFEVADPNQLYEMFYPNQNESSKPSLDNILRYLFRYPAQEGLAWKAELAKKITNLCLDFFRDNGLVTSMAHRRLVDEVNDMLVNEMMHAEEREKQLRSLTPREQGV